MVHHSDAARERLARALAANAHVVPMLTGERELPRLPDAYRPGSADEAAICADLLLEAWKAAKSRSGRKHGR